ncbi:unnamed protein product [Pleuronectes platessa]|uniref:Uncharacterized protein n=1 Tax=Pleuronectes platessa TaxID=8262 RepID=A0A9N7TWD0_PLEPL|nr:unnamed protein product [Pleuronectes platessa]
MSALRDISADLLFPSSSSSPWYHFPFSSSASPLPSSRCLFASLPSFMAVHLHPRRSLNVVPGDAADEGHRRSPSRRRVGHAPITQTRHVPSAPLSTAVTHTHTLSFTKWPHLPSNPRICTITHRKSSNIKNIGPHGSYR